jgi:hypothetical protein
MSFHHVLPTSVANMSCQHALPTCFANICHQHIFPKCLANIFCQPVLIASLANMSCQRLASMLPTESAVHIDERMLLVAVLWSGIIKWNGFKCRDPSWKTWQFKSIIFFQIGQLMITVFWFYFPNQYYFRFLAATSPWNFCQGQCF